MELNAVDLVARNGDRYVGIRCVPPDGVSREVFQIVERDASEGVVQAVWQQALKEIAKELYWSPQKEAA